MARRPFRATDSGTENHTRASLRWALKRNEITRVLLGVYVEGSEPPSPMEQALGLLVALDGVASGSLAGVLHQLDGVDLRPPYVTVPRATSSAHRGVRRRALPVEALDIVDDYLCTDPLQTLVDLAGTLNVEQWEQAFESALRMQLVTVEDVSEAAARTPTNRRKGVSQIREVLAMRPDGAPPTESLLETLTVQLIRKAGLPDPCRQVEVRSAHDTFIARVDLAWPNLGVFLELDGAHHRDQPDHDARRETALTAATGWLPGRFTWREVTRAPRTVARRIEELLARAAASRAS